MPDAVVAAANSSPPTSSPGDFELKFVIDGRNASLIRRWLQCVCRPDPVHPTGVVSSIYFDTPSLDHLRQKINSEYFKTKIRLRWYDVPGAAPEGSFLEAKLRVGTRRRKIRLATSHAGDVLSRVPLHNPLFHQLATRLRTEGVLVASALRAVLLVRYTRHRFVDVVSRLRISLDTNISTPAINRQLLPTGNPRPLSTAVVEVKGDATDLPPSLRPLATLGARKAAFSKYLACYDRTVTTIG